MTDGGIPTKLFANTLQLIQISLVLLLVFDFLLDTLEYPHGSSIIIDASGCTEGSLDNRRRGNEIMGEAVVESSLNLEKVLSGLEEADISFSKALKSLLTVCAGGKTCRSMGDAGEGRASANDSGEEAGAHHDGENNWFVVEDVEDNEEENAIPTPKCGGKVVSSLARAGRDSPRFAGAGRPTPCRRGNNYGSSMKTRCTRSAQFTVQ
jgi:hypothetical protein